MFFFFNDTATTEIYTLSLHDALPISPPSIPLLGGQAEVFGARPGCDDERIAGVVARIARETQRACREIDRKSTRLNSSHDQISYAVFCLKKKKNTRLIGSPE